MTFSVGCLLGGASSVAKSDLAVLRGKNCILPLFDTSDLQSQLDFVMKVAARLRKMYITPQFVQIPSPYSRIFDAPQDGQPFEEPEVTELSLSALCALANRCQIFVPEELRSDYLGDITSLIESKSPDSVIPELFQLGDVLAAEVREDELMPMLTAHLARCFQNGNDVFPKLWRVERAFHTTVFVDGVQDKTAQALRGTGVRVCDVRFASAPENERLEMFRGVIAPTQIVLFASFELWEHAEAFLEVLRWCRQNEVAAILLTPEKGGANREEVWHMVTRTITVARIDGKAGMTVAVAAEGIPSIEAVFDPSGGLQQAKELSLDKREQVAPVQVRPSVPFEGKSLAALNDLPVEKRLAAIQAGSLPK